MKNLSRVRSEFTRQAEAFADSAVPRGAEVTVRIADPSHTSFLAEDALAAAISAAGFASISQTTWQTQREFGEWARIISDSKRMSALELVLRHLARAGSDTGMALEEKAGRLAFSYRWGLFVARAE